MMHRGPSHPAKILFGALAVALAAGALAAACGGSSSESPWPVEPEHTMIGPEGEEGAPRRDAAPDAGPDAAPNVEP